MTSGQLGPRSTPTAAFDEPTRCLDVRRVSVHARFFSVFAFESGEDLLQIVSGIEIDPDVVAGSGDLRVFGLSGSLYWLLYVKGYLQWAERGDVDGENAYFQYLTRHFARDPGITDDLLDADRARELVRRRFDDFALFRDRIAHDPGVRSLIDPLEVTILTLPHREATVVFELDSDRPVICDVDGYHRIFAARVFGIRWLPARFIEESLDPDIAEFYTALRQLVRFSLPHDAHVAVLSEGDERVFELDGRPRKPLVIFSGPEDLTPEEHVSRVAAEIESARRGGVEFLLLAIPDAASIGSRLLAYCDEHFRRVAHEAGVAAVYFLGEGTADARDEVGPLPPPEMTQLATSIRDPVTFQGSGLAGIRSMEAVLTKNGFRLEDFRAILDFGCGCGRLLRHLGALEADLHGADYNPYFVDWCERSIPFARFARTRLTPGLPFSEATFDFIFTVATFSQLDETLQRPWFRELERVLRPGGVLFMTVKGLGRAAELGAEAQDQFMSGELVVVYPWLSGTNGCSAYHPESYIREKLTTELDLVDIVPGGAPDVRQDAVLLRKPA